MAEMYFEPNEVWDFYEKDSNDTDFVIATDDKFGIEIFVSTNLRGMKPSICVECYGDQIDEEFFDNSDECERIATEFYSNYIDGNIHHIIEVCNSKDKPEEIGVPPEEMSVDEMIDERELELEIAVDEFLATVAPDLKDYTDDIDEVYEEVIEIVCRYLYKNYDVSVYRPMYLEDKNCEPCLSMRPYEEMEF